MTRRFWAGLAIVAASILAVAVIGYLLLRPTPPPRLTLRSASFDQLSGWRDDAQAAALPAFRRSCAAFLAQPADAPLDPRNKSTRFGSPADWRRACDAAAAVPQGDNNAAREFFETNFTPFLAGNGESSEGLFTGYFEMSLNGSRQRSGRYQTPLYRRPPEPDRTKYRRDEIEDGALAGRGLELLWVDDPVDAFFLEIQGSGRVRLPDGNVVRIGYDGANGKPYVVIGRLLVERGELPREQVTMAAIRGWMRAHPKEAAALRRENPSFVFFREIPGDGPLGAEQIVLTAGRSLAVAAASCRSACRCGSTPGSAMVRTKSADWSSPRIPAVRSRGRCAAICSGATARRRRTAPAR